MKKNQMNNVLIAVAAIAGGVPDCNSPGSAQQNTADGTKGPVSEVTGDPGPSRLPGLPPIPTAVKQTCQMDGAITTRIMQKINFLSLTTAAKLTTQTSMSFKA